MKIMKSVIAPASNALDEDQIRDPDLRAHLEETRNTPYFSIHVRSLVESQRKRDQEAASLAALTQSQQRQATIREGLWSAPATIDDLRHIHSVLAVCGLPFRRLPIEQREFEKRQGRMALTVEAGKLRSPETGERVAQPVPFGPKARLLMMHLCSEAVQQNSNTIEIADNLTSFMRDMGFPATGGKKGTLHAFKEQLNALAAARMSIAVWDGQRSSERYIQPFTGVDIWLPTNPDERMLWPTTLTFSLDFYQSLKKHALPVNIKAVRAFSNSARKLDAYFWLGYRMTSLKQPKLMVSWQSLAGQFGEGYALQRQFKAAFADDINDIQQVFPKLPVRLTDAGLELTAVDPEVFALPSPKASASKGKA